MGYSKDYQTKVAGRVREGAAENARVWNRGGFKVSTPAGTFEVGASKKSSAQDPVAAKDNIKNDAGKQVADKDPKVDIVVGQRGSHGVGSKTA